MKINKENLLLYKINEIFEIFKNIDLHKFCCENDEVNEYLYNIALISNEKLLSKTYIIINKENNDIVGFFTLSASLLKLKESKKYDISGVPAILLGRIGVDNKYRHQYIGEFLLEMALGICEEVKELIGCRLILTENVAGSKILDYFKKLGFQF